VRSGLIAAALVAALSASSLLSNVLPASGSGDVLLDEGFEAGVADSDWAPDGGALTTTSAIAHSGEMSAMFSVEAAPTGAIQSRTIAVRPQANYVLNAFFLKNDPRVESITLQVRWEDANRTSIDRPRTTLTGSDAAWRSLTLDEQSPRDAAFATVQVLVVSDEGGTIYVDDLRLEGPPPLPATPTLAPSDTAWPSPSSTVTSVATGTPTRTPSATPSAVPSLTPTPGIAHSLTNGGFEEANDGLPNGWQKYGGELSQTSGQQRSGRYSGEFRSSTDSTKWAYQVVAVSGGNAYQFDSYVLLNDPAAQEVFLRISWYASDDASGSAIGVSDSQQRLSGSDPTFRFLTTGPALAPSDARSARFRIMLVPASSAPATVYLDDASLQQVTSELAATPAPPPPAEQVDAGGNGTTREEVLSREKPLTAAVQANLPRQGESPYAVKINEVMYDPSQPGDDAAYEWLELYNAGNDGVDLAGWTLSDNSGGAVALPSLVLASHRIVVVAAGQGFHEVYPDFALAVVTVASGRIGSGLANKGDHMLLYDASGKLADGVSWGDDTSVLSPAVAAVPPGHSIERSPAGHDTDAASDFVDNASPSPGRGFGEKAVAGAAVQREAAGSSTISPPAGAMQEASNNLGQRLLVSFAAGIVSLAVGLSIGFYGRRRLRHWP